MRKMADEKSIAPEENYHLLERKKWWKKWLIPNCALIVMIIAPWAWLIIYIISYDNTYNESYSSIFGVLSIIAFIYAPIWALITRSTNRWGLLAVAISLIPLWLIYIPPWETIAF